MTVHDRMLLGLLAHVILWATNACAQQLDRLPSQPNIVFILCDDLGYGDIQAFNPERGKIPTPSIDRLSTEGMMFTDAHASSAVCTPSRYSILTGRYSWRSRLQSGVLGGMSEPLVAPSRKTVASFLKDQGYTTACIGKWHLGLGFSPQRFTSQLADGPLQHGFDHFFGIAASLDMPPFAWIEDDHFPEVADGNKTVDTIGSRMPSFEAVDVMPMLTKKAVEYIRTHGKGGERPFFLYLTFTAPHTPIVPAPEWKGKSGLGDYADFVMQTDAAVGEVLKAIDEAGLRENTMVYFTSDNGVPAAGPNDLEAQGHFPSAEFRGYKSDIWEGGHRIPLIVRWPSIVAPRSKSAQLVGLIDLFATTADILQQRLPDNAAEDSFSILPILKGKDVPVRASDIHHSIDGCFAVREGNWKLELCAGSGGWGAPREPKAVAQHLPNVQLYDLASDPGEQRNVEAEHPEIAERLTGFLEKSIANGRTSPGPPQKNDVRIKIRKQPAAAPEAADESAVRRDQDSSAPGALVAKQHVYKTVDNRKLTLDVDTPPDWKPTDQRPAVVFFFGGGWRNGTPNQFKPQAEYFARRGLVCFRADYRVRRRDGVLPDKCVEDAISAVRWIRGHAAELGIDPDRIVAAGASAGGHLAACTFFADGINAPGEDQSISAKPDSMLLYNLVVDLVTLPDARDNNLVAGLDETVLKQISPADHARKDTPPTLIIDGTADRLNSQIRRFIDKSQSLGAPIEASFTEGQPHGFFNKPPWLGKTTEEADAFLRRIGYLKDDPKVPLPTRNTGLPPD